MGHCVPFDLSLRATSLTAPPPRADRCMRLARVRRKKKLPRPMPMSGEAPMRPYAPLVLQTVFSAGG